MAWFPSRIDGPMDLGHVFRYPDMGGDRVPSPEELRAS